MFIIWGTHHYGKTDEVPGLFHIATNFGHIWYIPLFPTATHLIFGQDADGFQGIKIPLSGKSILLGWMRAACLITFLISGIGIFVTSQGESGAWMIPSAICASSFVSLLLFCYGRAFRPAGYERARALGRLAGFDEQGMMLIDLHFGKIDEARAKALLEKAEAEDIAAQEKELAERKARFGRSNPPDADR